MALNQQTKDTFDVIRAIGSYLGILTIAITLFFYEWKQGESIIYFSNISIVSKCISLCLVIFPFIIYFSDNINILKTIRIRYVIWRGNLSGHIIEKEELIIDIFDKEGKTASYYQKIYFHKINYRNRNQYLASLEVSGQIDATSIQSLNCYYALNHEQNTLKLSYINNIGKLNDISNFFRKNDKFLMFYVILKDTFITKDESWEIEVRNLCQDYNLQILMPKDTSLKCAKFLRINGHEEVIQDIQPLIIHDNERQKIVLQVMNFDKNENYRVKWELN